MQPKKARNPMKVRYPFPAFRPSCVFYRPTLKLNDLNMCRFCNRVAPAHPPLGEWRIRQVAGFSHRSGTPRVVKLYLPREVGLTRSPRPSEGSRPNDAPLSPVLGRINPCGPMRSSRRRVPSCPVCRPQDALRELWCRFPLSTGGGTRRGADMDLGPLSRSIGGREGKAWPE